MSMRHCAKLYYCFSLFNTGNKILKFVEMPFFFTNISQVGYLTNFTSFNNHCQSHFSILHRNLAAYNPYFLRREKVQYLVSSINDIKSKEEQTKNKLIFPKSLTRHGLEG